MRSSNKIVIKMKVLKENIITKILASAFECNLPGAKIGDSSSHFQQKSQYCWAPTDESIFMSVLESSCKVLAPQRSKKL
jgi:hypothetical protein